MKIILIGFMGSGKTTVANVLAKKLNLEVIEMDNLILKKSDRKSISEIFSLDGEEHFRDLETIVVKEISGLNNVIISTSGGIITKERNLKHLKNGTIFFLKTSFEIIEKRLQADDMRPLFKNKTKARELFDLRQKIYGKWAHQIILTDEKSIDEVVNNLMEHL
jgi:shikimate kinase